MNSQNGKTKIVSVIGLGYIGLPTATLLASNGFVVRGVDINSSIVDTINKGEIHIVEPGLAEQVKIVVSNGSLSASTTVGESDVYIIAVPTPFKRNHEPDISYVEMAARSIAPVLRKGNLVILESTSPVGTTNHIMEMMASLRPDLIFPLANTIQGDVHFAYCPERVMPGKTMHELVHNDRVIGGIHPCCSHNARELYKTFVKGECFLTDARTAEMTKLTENAFRDVNIAFANELSMICDKMNINVWELIRLANRHPRVNILNPGPGVGGHCIAVDPWFIVHSAPDESKLIRTARTVNDTKPVWVVNKIKKVLQQDEFKGKKPILTCLGLSFKANVDDLRESPAVEIVERLAALDVATLYVVEPYISEVPAQLQHYKNIHLVDSTTGCAKGDIIIGLVDHTLFKEMDRSKLGQKIILDFRGIWEPSM